MAPRRNRPRPLVIDPTTYMAPRRNRSRTIVVEPTTCIAPRRNRQPPIVVEPTTCIVPRRNRQPPIVVEPTVTTSASSESTPIALNNTTQCSASSAISKRVRGQNRGLDLSRTNGKVIIDIPEGKNRPVGAYCCKLSREIGIIVRQYAPLKVKGWTEVSEEEKSIIYDRVMEKFDLQMELPRVKKCVDELAQDRYKDFRCSLHKKFKEAGGGAVARANPPKDLITRRDDWNWLCEHFESESFQIRSKAGSANREKLKFVHRTGSRTFVAVQEQLGCDRIELYRQTYYGDKGWAHKEAEARYEQMIILQSESYVGGEATLPDNQICSQVLGTRSGYVPGYGRGPKPRRMERYLSDSSYNNTLVELNKTKEELAATKEELDMAKTLIASNKEELDMAKTTIKSMEKKVNFLFKQFWAAQEDSSS